MNSPSTRAAAALLTLSAVSAPSFANEDDPAAAGVEGLIGLGVATIPDAPGSDTQRTVPLPVVNLRFGQTPFFLGNRYGGTPLQAGMAFNAGEHWRFGAALGAQAEDPREATDAQRAAGVQDIDRAGLASVFAQWRYERFTATATGTQSLGDSEQGQTATLRLQREFQPTPRVRITLGPSATWADGEHMRTYYGVPVGNAQYATYTPSGGLQDVSMNAGISFAMTPQWIVGSGLQVSRLQSDAKDSPLVEDDTQTSASLFIARRF